MRNSSSSRGCKSARWPAYGITADAQRIAGCQQQLGQWDTSMAEEKAVMWGTEAGTGLSHIARFVETFEVGRQLWLVFRHEGIALSRLLYAAAEDGGEGGLGKGSGRPEKHGGAAGAAYHLVGPSKWWKWLRSTEEGELATKSILRQLVTEARSL